MSTRPGRAPFVLPPGARIHKLMAEVAERYRLADGDSLRSESFTRPLAELFARVTILEERLENKEPKCPRCGYCGAPLRVNVRTAEYYADCRYCGAQNSV